MRVLVFANNWVGWQVAAWLRAQGDEVVGVVVHPQERARFRDAIIEAAMVEEAAIFDGSQLQEPRVLQAIGALGPEIGVSALFGYILRRRLLELLPKGCVNIHPALLPFNRGAYPNVWSIVEQTPAGATLHWIDEGVDTGAIIAQHQVDVTPVDTGASLYQKLEQASLALFQATWPFIRVRQAVGTPQNLAEGTTHRVRDVDRIDAIDLDQRYTARELINILRARTFPPHRGAYIWDGNRKVYLELQLRYDDEHNS